MNYSKYQLDIFDAIEYSEENLIIEAVAGSGKTTTIVEALKRIPSDQRILFCAFNKHIAEELARRVPRHVEVCTLNSLGWRACTRRFGREVRLDAGKTREVAFSIIPEFLPGSRVKHPARGWVGAMEKLVGLLKAYLHDDFEFEQSWFNEAAAKLVERNAIEIPTDLKAFYLLAFDIWQACIAETGLMDFDDQIFFPIHFDLPLPEYDVVMIDEAQDLSTAQAEMVARAGRRVIAVGDTRQAIYGFRGADPEAMPRLGKKLECKSMPLSICYRCPVSHVALAKEIVPQIEAAPNAKNGSVGSISPAELLKEAQSGDYVLCRTTAPLVSSCIKMIVSGKKATLKGRDIGTQLANFIEKISDRSGSETPAFLERLKAWFDAEKKRLSATSKTTQPLEDRYESVVALSEGCKTVNEILKRIEEIFSDKEDGVIFATVHRAKGLEGERIFILHRELMPHPAARRDWQIVQEMNLLYVALTRSKDRLYFVEEGFPEDRQATAVVATTVEAPKPAEALLVAQETKEEITDTEASRLALSILPWVATLAQGKKPYRREKYLELVEALDTLRQLSEESS